MNFNDNEISIVDDNGGVAVEFDKNGKYIDINGYCE